MQIECISSGLVQSNVYIISQNGEAVIIDCGCSPEKILGFLEKNELIAKHVILTHGHFDHIFYMDALRKKIDVKVNIHEQDANCMTDPELNGLSFFPVKGASAFEPPDHILHHGDCIECGGLQFKIIHTPGHTKGGICINVEDSLFTGDTLFRASIGRTDLPGGSMTMLEASIREKLYQLPDDTVVYPGHGAKTTIGYEKSYNPYVSA